MNKENQQTDHPSNIRSYFTKEINARISEMSDKQMISYMKDLATTEYWIALLKYTSMRTPILDAILRGTDPVKEPSKVSWAQGCMAGICDIEGYIVDLNTPRSKEENEEDQNKENSTIIG
jgi:hypothetical protein